MKQVPLLVILLALCGSTAFAQDSPVVEGYVFSALNGVPLQNVEVLLSIDGSIETSVARPVQTDSNGFFSIAVRQSEVGRSVQISASCLMRHRDGIRTFKTSAAHPLIVSDGQVNRNLYIRIPTQRSAQECEGFLISH